MSITGHLVEWDSLYLRIRGPKVQEAISRHLKMKPSPVSELSLQFTDGKIMVSATIQKGLSIPVTCTVSRIAVAGKTLKAVVENVSTFGGLPIPRSLFSLPWLKELPKGITLDPETLTVEVDLQQFLPSFIDLTIESIRIVPGGVVLQLGAGGADLPDQSPPPRAMVSV